MPFLFLRLFVAFFFVCVGVVLQAANVSVMLGDNIRDTELKQHATSLYFSEQIPHRLKFSLLR